MNTIYVVRNQHGVSIPFIATSLVEARRRAVELGGARHRGITIIEPTHRDHAYYARILGVNPT